MSDEWVMVPREASEAMIRAGYSAPTVFGVRDMANTYRAMLAAAPDAPQRNREADRARYIDRAFNEWLDDSVADGGATVWDLVSDVHSAWAAWTAHPHYAAPAAPQQAGQFDHLAGRGMHELRFDELTPYVLSLLAGRGQDTPDVRIALDWIVAELERKTNDERALAVKLDAIRAAPQQAEPVAWMKPTRDSCYLRSAETMLAIHEDFDGIARTGWTPLYLHPPPAEVQAGACPHCGSDCNERDELTKAEREITRLRAEVDALRENNHGWLRANGPGGWIDALRADAALKRDLLLWALYHAQGGSSRVGQAIRRHLGIEQHARLTPEQIKDAERAAQGASDATN